MTFNRPIFTKLANSEYDFADTFYSDIYQKWTKNVGNSATFHLQPLSFWRSSILDP
jgi:hypothetical protein